MIKKYATVKKYESNKISGFSIKLVMLSKYNRFKSNCLWFLRIINDVRRLTNYYYVKLIDQFRFLHKR